MDLLIIQFLKNNERSIRSEFDHLVIYIHSFMLYNIRQEHVLRETTFL
jgi:hypothetical protein